MFSITGMAFANRVFDRTQCQFGCNRPTSYKPSSETGSTFGLGRNRQWYVVYVYVVFLWTLTLLYRSAPNRCHSGVQEGDGSLRAAFFGQIRFAKSSNGTLSLFATVSIVTHVITRSCSRVQRNNDRIRYNFQRCDEAVSFRPLEIQE